MTLPNFNLDNDELDEEDDGISFIQDSDFLSSDDGINFIDDINFDPNYKTPPQRSIANEFSRGFMGGATPTFNSPSAERKRDEEAFSTPEELINVVEEPDVLPGYTDIPNMEELQKTLLDIFGIKDESEQSKYAERIGKALGGALRFPGATPSSLASFGIGAAGGQGVEQLTGSELAGDISEVVLGGVAGAGIGGLGKSAAPSALSKTGQKLGLAEKTIVPLETSKNQKAFLGKIAAKGKKTENLLEKTKQDLGSGFEQLSQEASSLPALNPSQTKKIASQFEDVTEKITKTLANTPDEKAALEFINQALTKLESTGATPEELVNFYRTINSKVNWRNMSRGDIYKNEIKNVIKDTLKETNPAFAENFEAMNNFYSKYFDLEKALGQSDMQKALTTFNDLRKIGQVGYGLVTLNPIPLVEAMGEQAFQVYARESLINPTIMRFNKAIARSASEGSEKTVKSLINKQIEYLKKEYPQHFKELTIPIEK